MLGRMIHHEDTPAVGPRHYRMRERIISIGDDYDVEDEFGRREFHIDGKALRLRHTLKFEDAHGHELYTIQDRVARLRDSMAIERDGRKVAEVHKALVAPLRERLDVSVEGAPDMEVQGNLLDHEYQITRGGRLAVATVSKRWFRIADTYGVEVMPGQDDALILAVTVCVDAMLHDQ